MAHLSVTKSLAMNRPEGGAIIGIRGSNIGRILRIQPEVEIVLGRDAERCDICFQGQKVSRRHCGVVYHSAKKDYTVLDYSSNGILKADGQALKKGENHGVAPGTELWLGTKEEAICLG